MDLLPNWTKENRQKLFEKMNKLGIMKGGIFNTLSKNLNLYKQLILEFERS